MIYSFWLNLTLKSLLINKVKLKLKNTIKNLMLLNFVLILILLEFIII